MHRPSLPLRVALHGLALVLSSPLLLGTASAQNEVTGTVRATLDGEEREWVTVALEESLP